MRISTRMGVFNATYFNRHWLNILQRLYCRCHYLYSNDPFLLVAVFVLLEVQIAFTIGLLIKKFYKEYVETFIYMRATPTTEN